MLPLLSLPEVNLRRKQDADDVRIGGKETNQCPQSTDPKPLTYLKPRIVLGWVKPVSLKKVNTLFL